MQRPDKFSQWTSHVIDAIDENTILADPKNMLGYGVRTIAGTRVSVSLFECMGTALR